MQTIAPIFWSSNTQILRPDGSIVARPAISAAQSTLDDQIAALSLFFDAIETERGEPVVASDKIEIVAGPKQTFQCQTGGTTQTPKRIRRTTHSWGISIRANETRFGLADPIYATLGHLGHSLTLYAATEAITIGAKYLPLGGVAPSQQVAGLQLNLVNVLYATPTQMRLLALVNGADLPHLRFIMVGGGALDQQTQVQIRSIAPNAQVLQFYGAAETSFITLANNTNAPNCVGQPYDHVELRITDRDTETGIGRIWVKSPYLFQDYALGSSPDTQWDGEWLTIGELGTLDPQGNLVLAGRQSRMFTVADKNLFPEEIETLFLSHPDVVACAILPQPDALRGYRPVAMVASQRGDISDVLAELAQTLDTYMQPARYFCMTPDEWPMLISGKPDLRALQVLL